MVLNRKNRIFMLTPVLLVLFATAAFSGTTTPDALLKGYEIEAKKENKAFSGFNADRGEKFYLAERKDKKGKTVSCAGCHTKDPTKQGKTNAKKVIEPMAVSANNKRFTDKAKVEKWFKRNCDDVYERACTAQEKGDFISFLKTR